jgi:hypothetical protein
MNTSFTIGPLGTSAPPSPRPAQDRGVYYQWFQLADLGTSKASKLKAYCVKQN